MQIQQILRTHFDILERATHGCLSTIASQLYACNIISEPVRDSVNYAKILKEFTSKMELISDVSELQSHCDTFLKCVHSGGPTDSMVQTLAQEWGEVFHLANPLSQTESFGSTPSPLISSSSSLSFSTKTSKPAVKRSRSSSSTSSSSPGFVAHDEVVYFSDEFEEQEVSTSLTELRKSFAHLMRIFKSAFKEMKKEDNLLAENVSVWVEEYMRWRHETVDRNLDDIFQKIYGYYDFIDCALIVDMSEEFLKDVTFNNENIVEKLKSHSLESKALLRSAPISHLKEVLEKKYEPYERNLEDMPKIRIQLVHCWDKITIGGLYLLIEKLLPIESRQSIIKYISIRSGSVVIHYSVLDCTADSLRDYYCEAKLQFMPHIGIFSLHINEKPVLQENENKKFTFELALLEAVTAGHNEAVEFLLQLKTFNIDHTNEEGKTALMLACERGHEDIVHSLLSAGANVNLQDNNGWTALMRASKHNHISIINMLLTNVWALSDLSAALMFASFYGHIDILELLISKEVEYQHCHYFNAFMLACHNGQLQIVELLLLKKQIDPNLQEKNGFNSFMLACQNGHTQIVELLLEEQVDPNVQDKNGWNAIMLACHNGQLQIVELLLKKQIDPNLQEKNGFNAFMLACEKGHIFIVRLLLMKKVDIDVQDNYGVNALMLASQNGHTQIVELLLNEQVDSNAQTKDEWDALMLACDNGHTEIAELLTKKGKVDPSALSIDGWNPFMLACKNGHIQTAIFLLTQQVDPSFQDTDGWSAFMSACEKGHYHIVELLLKEQVDPNIQDIHGWSPFMLACQNGHTEVVHLLLREHVNPNVQDMDGWNAFILGCQNGHTKIVELLLEEQVDPNVQNKDGVSAFMLACQNGHTQIVELLLKKQVDPNISNFNGVNPLMLACQNGHFEIVQLLLEGYINIYCNCQDKYGYTALMLASQQGHYEVVNLLLESKADISIEASNGSTAISVARTLKIVNLLHLYSSNEHDKSSELQHDTARVLSSTSLDAASSLFEDSINGPGSTLFIAEDVASLSSENSINGLGLTFIPDNAASLLSELFIPEDAASLCSAISKDSVYYSATSSTRTSARFPSTLTLTDPLEILTEFNDDGLPDQLSTVV